MLGFLLVFIVGLAALFAFFLWVLRDMRRGRREMERLTREVEALLEDGVSGKI